MADKDVALGNCSVSFQLSFILPYGTVHLRTSVLQSTWLNLNASFVHTHSVLFTLCKLLVCLSASCFLFCCLMLQVFVVCTGRSCHVFVGSNHAFFILLLISRICSLLL